LEKNLFGKLKTLKAQFWDKNFSSGKLALLLLKLSLFVSNEGISFFANTIQIELPSVWQWTKC